MQRSGLLDLAGLLMVLVVLIILFYGLGGLDVYFASLSYYNTPDFVGLYLGIWNSCAFPFVLVGTIFLYKKRHMRLCIMGMFVALVSGFVPVIIFAVVNNYATNGLELGAPLIFLSGFSLALVAISKG